MQRPAFKIHKQNGQAMVEFVVAALFFLGPLFLAIAVLGKFIDVQHTVDMASRYVAWERTVWYEADGNKFNSINDPNQKSAAGIQNEVAVRLLNDRSTNVTVIKDSDKSATSFVNGLDPMWRDPADVTYLDAYNQMVATISKEKPSKDFAGAALGVFSSLAVLDDLAGTLVPPVPSDTMAVAKINFNKVARNSGTYQRLWESSPVWDGLDFEATGAILSNTWAANSAQGTKGMVSESVPTSKLFGTALKVGTIAGIGPWDATVPLRIDIGKIAVDQVPPDRLK